MPRAFRRWYRRRYGRRSYSRFRRRYRRYKKFVNNSSRSRVRVKIPITVNAQMTVPANSTVSNVLSICPFYGNTTLSGTAVGCLLGDVFGSPLYTAYSGLYDEVKCDGFKLNFSITSGIGLGGTFPSLSVYTSVDRRLTYNDFSARYDAAHPNNPHYPIASELKNSSSYLAAVALNNSVTKMVRRCYASDLFEKCSFVDATPGTQSYTVNGQASQTVRQFAATQPMFNPVMYFACDTGSSVDAANSRDCNVVIEIMYYLTFRNPKYGGGAGTANRTIAIPRGPIFPDDDDGDMDEDVPAAAASVDASASIMDSQSQADLDAAWERQRANNAAATGSQAAKASHVNPSRRPNPRNRDSVTRLM